MIVTWLGILAGFGFILLGNHLEGGHIDSLIQVTAAMIVFGGTLGSALVNSTQAEVIGAMKLLKKAFLAADPKFDGLVKQLVELANVARKDGILALDSRMGEVKNEFLSSNLRKVIDGYDPKLLVQIMEDSMHHHEDEGNAAAKILTDTGAFSPTIGILGAVLGLIHVMSNLSDPSKLGAGIAVAFVATVYGVGAANLVLIPLGAKCKKIVKLEGIGNQLIFTAVMGIQNGLNPRVIEEQLNTISGAHHGSGDAQKKAA